MPPRAFTRPVNPTTPRATEDEEARRVRVLALLRAAAAAFPDPHAASAWLHADHPALLGVPPAVAAWYGERTAYWAARALAEDTSPRQTAPAPPEERSPR